MTDAASTPGAARHLLSFAAIIIALISNLIPLFGVLLGWIFLGEALPAATLAGGALVLAGTILVTRS